MRILKICKYPPIEGGESSKNYWKILGLLKKGIDVIVLTNSYEVEENYRETIDFEDLKRYNPKNLTLINTHSFMEPDFIPYFNPYTIKLINNGIAYIEKNKVDIIEGSYLLPYAVAAHYLAQLYNIPLVITHAGSDITRLIEYNQYKYLLTKILQNADAIITYPNGRNFFMNKGVKEEKIFEIKQAIDTNSFNKKIKGIDKKKLGAKEKDFVFTHFGKINPNKGIYELIQAASKVKKNFKIIFIGQGKGEEKFKEYVKEKKMTSKVKFLKFVAPWKVPEIMKSSDCMLSVENRFNVSVHAPLIGRESIAIGKPVIVSKEINYYKNYPKNSGIKIIDPDDLKNYSQVLEEIIVNYKKHSKEAEKGRKFLLEDNNFDYFIKDNIKVYRKLLNIKD
jgi:glycosyltransferase involved in cell wall biosynthesis